MHIARPFERLRRYCPSRILPRDTE